MNGLTHALSFDVEDFASGAVLAASGRVVTPSKAVVSLTDRVLSILDEFDVHATFFVLGDVAETFPDLVRKITSRSHEIGVHGWHHHRIFQLERDEYRESIRKAKGVLEDLTGVPVQGYRAVAMSLTAETCWAYEVLAELGFGYSSSVFPFKGKRYGVPDAPVGPHCVTTKAGGILEVPLSVLEFGPIRIPVLGGGYLRHYPVSLNTWALRTLEREGRAAVVYMHPYEFDTSAPARFAPTPATKEEARRMAEVVRGQFRNRIQSEAKLRTLLRQRDFASLREVFSPRLEACRKPSVSE